MKIFYIDDDPDEVLIFCDAIREINPSIDCWGLTDSKSGIEQLEDEPAPDLIFLDYNMPGLTGEDCLVKIRSVEHLKFTPVIIYSTGVVESEKQRLLGKGASMVIKKHNSSAALKAFFTKTFLSADQH